MQFSLSHYRAIFAQPAYRNFWISYTLSVIGDMMTQVSLTWYVWETSHSAWALGWLTFFYTFPVVIGGLVAGWLLDRFERKQVMMVDNLARGAVLLGIPILHWLGWLQIYHIYIAAGVYGGLMMISLAGVPAMIPALVSREQLDSANSLEVLSFTLSGVFGPLIAGFLIPILQAPNVVVFDCLSYFLFAAVLARLPVKHTASPDAELSFFKNIKSSVGLLLGSPVLLSTTLMFMSFNFGQGMSLVWLPIYADLGLHGGPGLFGLLMGFQAVGEVSSSFLSGSLKLSAPLGLQISLAQCLSGLGLSLILMGNTVWLAAGGLFLLGFFSAPLSVWAQTLRMAIIPEDHRGRAFALLRTLMQSANPLGGILAGSLLPVAGIIGMMCLSVGFIGAPGVIGSWIKELRNAGTSEERTRKA